MDLAEIRALPIEERDRILEIQVDFSRIADALNMCANVLHGIIEAETVAEISPDDMNDAETSLPIATEALGRLRAEFERSEKYLKSAARAFGDRISELEARVKFAKDALELARPILGFHEYEPWRNEMDAQTAKAASAVRHAIDRLNP